MTKIVVIGLGYVGLPLAAALSRRFDTIGFDIDEARVAELREGHDRTSELDSERLAAAPLALTTSAEDCRAADVYIITVPTPVDSDNRPDLGAVLAATRMVAGLLDAAR